MQKVRNYRDGINALLEGNILVYKPYNYKPVFLKLKTEDKIIAFNFNMRYSITKKDLDELFQELRRCEEWQYLKLKTLKRASVR